MPSAGVFTVLATVLAFVAVGIQLSTVAGNEWWRATMKNNGKEVVMKLGLFTLCVESTHDTTSPPATTEVSTCMELTKMLDETEPRYCPSGTPSNEDLRGKTQGTQAVAIMTLLASVGYFAVVLVVACGKMKNALVPGIIGLCTSAGAIGTFVLAFTTLNNSCKKTWCEMIKDDGYSSCHGSYGPYFEFITVFMIFGSIACLALSLRKGNGVAPPPQWSSIGEEPTPPPSSEYAVPPPQ